MVFRAVIRDLGKNTANAQRTSSSQELVDYDLPGDGEVNKWNQTFDPWRATVDVELNNGEAPIPLLINDDQVVDGKDIIKWEIAPSANFGFKKKKYTFTEGDGEVEIQVSDDKKFRKNKTVTIEIEDNDTDTSGAGTDTSGASVETSENDPLTGGAGANTFDTNSLSEGIDNSPDFTRQESNKPLVPESGFGGGLAEGDPLTEQLTIGSAAIGSDDFIYDSSVLPLISSDTSVIV
jgi:hypothetical protein